MRTCRECFVRYDGFREDLCDDCAEKLRRWRFVDPTNVEDWLAFQRFQVDMLRERMINMRYPQRDDSGICGVCKRPFDDHRLTWAKDFYPKRLCPAGVAKPDPVPAQFNTPDDFDQYYV